jgi:hypothetical protein
MTTKEIVRKVISVLEALGVPYMLVGSFSSNAYGLARNTHDADFVVQLGAVPISEIASRLGPAFKLDSQMSFETITATSRYFLTVPGDDFSVELFLLSDDPHDQQRFDRRREAEVLGAPAYLPTPEDVLITKLRWSRHGKRRKDVDDAINVISVSGNRLDWPYIEHWCDQHQTRQLLEDLRKSIANS